MCRAIDNCLVVWRRAAYPLVFQPETNQEEETYPLFMLESDTYPSLRMVSFFGPPKKKKQFEESLLSPPRVCVELKQKYLRRPTS